MRFRLLLAFLLGALSLAACGGAVGSDAAKCLPACAAGKICCAEPNHNADGGVASTWVCVVPTGAGNCPVLP